MRGISLPERQTCRGARGIQATRIQIGMHGRKCSVSELWCKEVKRKKKQKQQHINGTENILLKASTAERVRNHHQKSSSRPDSGVP